MNVLYKKKVKKRTIILAFFSSLWLSALILRLVQLQVIEHSRLKAEVNEQNRNINTISPKRGTIYDRHGVILARSITSQSVYYTPFIDETDDYQLKRIKKLRGLLELSETELKNIKQRINKNVPFIWVKRKVDTEVAERIETLDLRGINLTEENKRFYPHGKRAAQILGRVNIDDTGQSGVELKYNALLAGKKGKQLILRDAKLREYHFEILEEPEPGNDLILTIDETIQYIAEQELEQTLLQRKAKGGTVIICEPLTGEILALANHPTYDLNHPQPDPLRLDKIRGIHHIYDPGSTFKIITAAAALESQSIDLDDTFDCSEGAITIARKTFKDYKRLGILSFPEVIIHSSNVGTIQIGQHLGEECLFKTIKAFGFGQKTGIDLPAEENGICRSLNSWSQISLASLSIGYEISVTAIQMLQAMNAIANRGVVTTPKIVKKILVSSNEEKKEPLRYKRQISEETASTLASILKKVVQEGTGKAAGIKGYDIAGKTGTAQKIDPSSHAYSSVSHTASFIGFVTAEKPLFSMIVVIDDPQGQYYGGQVAAPVFRKIAEQVLQYLRIPPQEEATQTIIAAKHWRPMDQ